MSELVLPARWRGIQLRTFYMAIIAPISYLLLIYVMKGSLSVGMIPKTNTLVILFICLAMVGPVFGSSFVKRAFASGARKFRENVEGIAMVYDRMVLIRSALFEFTFLMGLAWFFITGDTTLLPMFFVAGTYFSIRRWPRKQEYFDFVLEAQAP